MKKLLKFIKYSLIIAIVIALVASVFLGWIALINWFLEQQKWALAAIVFIAPLALFGGFLAMDDE